ncbi:hypothetical protein KIPB_015495, partial [Kipferlia bialata]
VVPIREKANQAGIALEAAQKKLRSIQDALAKLDARLKQLTDQFEKGMCIQCACVSPCRASLLSLSLVHAHTPSLPLKG